MVEVETNVPSEYIDHHNSSSPSPSNSHSQANSHANSPSNFPSHSLNLSQFSYIEIDGINIAKVGLH